MMQVIHEKNHLKRRSHRLRRAWAAHINEINGRGDYYNFDVKWTSPKAWLSGRNENTIVGGLLNGLITTGGSFMYVGGTPYPIYLHGTVEIKP